MNQLPGTKPHQDGFDTDLGAAETREADFARALRAAIIARRTSLEALRRALEERGIQVSVATLSYWRSGRRKPDRGASMIALAELERVLRLPAGFLTSKVAPRRPGSAVASALPTHYRTTATPAVTGPGTPRDSEVVAAGLAELGLSWDDGLARLSYHDRMQIREDRTDGTHDVRTVLVAHRNGVDRFPIWYSHEDPHAFPFVTALSNCRLGRAVEFREKAAVAAEMLLEQGLDRGESVIVEHRVESIGQQAPMTSLFRRVGPPLRELVMEIRFPPRQLPRQVVQWRRVGDAAESSHPWHLVGNSSHLLVIDPAPGVYGLEWTW